MARLKMQKSKVEKWFSHMGAGLQFLEPLLKEAENEFAFSIDIHRRAKQEYFVLQPSYPGAGPEVLDCDAEDQHLLLLDPITGVRLLCGFDERHWFVCQLPGRVSTVEEAKLDLMPACLRDDFIALGKRHRNYRKNELFVRQGEWFFVPSEAPAELAMIQHHAPLSRCGGGKPHICEALYEPDAGGKLIVADHTDDVRAYGRVSHPDHATLVLKQWHRVYLNEEVPMVDYAMEYQD